MTPLASFNGNNGSGPVSGLIMDSSGNLYGTASARGANNDGTVFELAKGSSAITTLASFNGANGRLPVAGLIMDSSGNLYGTTVSGGANGDGTAFELAKGSGAITTLASFYGVNGSNPHGGLIMDSSGNFFGTTDSGGANGDGNVFELLTPSAHQPYFQFSGFPSSTHTGVSQTFTVTVKNADGTTDTGYAGTVHFTSTDPVAVLPANYPYTPADAGVHTFTAMLKTAGPQSITATDPVNVVFTASATTMVPLPGTPVRFSVAAPASATPGTPFSITVTAWDADNNVTTNYTGTVSFTSTPSGAVLPNPYTFTTADQGVHIFTNGVTLKTAGTQTITATGTAIPPGIVSWWPGNGNANDIVGSSNGTLVGGVTFATGISGQAFHFNGNGQYVSVGGSYSIQGPRSLIAWVNFQANSLALGEPIVTAGSPGQGDFFAIAGTGGENSGVHQNALYVDHWGHAAYRSSSTVTPNQWNHVAVTL